MAWNPSPEVAIARDYAKKFGQKRVIILFDDGERCGYTSYGETRALCDSAKRIAEHVWEPFLEAAGNEMTTPR